MNWDMILTAKTWLTLDCVSPYRMIDPYVARVCDGIYTIPSVVAGAGEGGPAVSRAGLFLWAPTDGAALRALSHDIEAFGRSVSELPPPELREAVHGTTYREIKSRAKKAGASPHEFAVYRIAGDGAFVCACIEAGRFKYFFQSRKTQAEERPFAVAVSLPQGAT